MMHIKFTPAPIAVCIFAHHALVKASYVQVLALHPLFHVLTGLELAAHSGPAVGIFDAEGPALHAELILTHQNFPALRPLLLMPSCDDKTSLSWLQCGVCGIVLHERHKEELPDAIEHVARGQLWFPAPVVRRWAGPQMYAAGTPQMPSATILTLREQEVITLVILTRSNKEIAEELKISERTAKFHISNILRKTEMKSRHDLLALPRFAA